MSLEVLYEGKPIGTPDAGAFWRVVEVLNLDCKATVLWRNIELSSSRMQSFRKNDPGMAPAPGQEYQVRALFLAPTALRAIRRVDPDGALVRHPASS